MRLILSRLFGRNVRPRRIEHEPARMTDATGFCPDALI